jgi:hypothetical protein
MGSRSFVISSVVVAAYAAGCIGPGRADDESAIKQSVITDCSSLPAASAIVPEKELIIRDLSVVEDACRAGWSGASCSTTLGKWTFGRLMASMSGTSDINSATARNFVKQWLASWLSAQTVGQDPTPVASRPLIGPVLLFRWLAASSCTSPAQSVRDPAQWLTALQNCSTLNLQAAPFRLSGIANRIDLDGRDYAGNNGAPGELRFVFGAINTATQQPVNAAVILEYKFPNTFPPQWWAAMFHNLSGTAFGASFNSQLQGLTDMVVETNAQPGGPNGGSSIGQIRSNENAFDVGQQWEFRQFGLPCATGTCQLAQVPVAQTPPLSANNSAALTSWIVANRATIATSHHSVPVSMLGGSSLSFNRTNSVIWNTTPDINTGHTLADPSNPDLSYSVRHNFAFSTCSGCHYLETLNQNQNFHISPRAAGAQAQLSGFLDKTDTVDPLRPGYPSEELSVPDPNPDSYDVINGTSYYFQYNEIWRRSCEVRRVLASIQTPFTTPTGHN